MTEYKLSYTASEINEKLGQVDTKVNCPKALNGNVLNGLRGQILKTNGDGTTTWANQETYTLTESDIEIIADKAYSLIEKEQNNIFSFDNADVNFARFALSASGKNYIYQQKEEFGHKDVENGYFVYNGGVVHHGITGGLDLPLPAGSYRITAEVYIPSGNTDRTTLSFGAWIAPSIGEDSEKYDIGVQDEWVEIEKMISVSEGDTAVYIYMHSYIDTYPFYIRNIRVISLNPEVSELTGWEGKKWVVVGDSITQKTEKSLKNYFDYISEKTGIIVKNMGVGGSGYKSNENNNSSAFYQRILNVPTDADVVTILGSGNDLGRGYELGDVTDTGTTTLCGCINTTIDNLYSILPVVQLGIITPNPWGQYNPADDTNDMAQYSAKIVEICRLRGIPCLDLYHCSGMRPWDSAFLEIAYPMNSEGTNRDSKHPNEIGHSILAPKIKAFLENLVL